jgi:multisubunit Na+/H+ antiporter MnhB subunit
MLNEKNMSAIKDTLKASIWGVLLLTLLITASTAAMFAYDKTINFYTPTKINEYKKTRDAINNVLIDLEQYMVEKEVKYDWYANSDEYVIEQTNLIKTRIEENCHTSCWNIYFSLPTRSYEVNKFSSKLESLTNNEETSGANKIVAFTFFMSLLTILFSIYLLVGLFRYKKLKANGLTILVLLISPFLVSSACFAVAHANEYMAFDISEGGVNTIVACIAYIFIIFPPVILISKKNGYSISKIIKLDGYVKAVD